MISKWTAALAIAVAQPAVPPPDVSAPDAEPLIITPSTIHDFDPGFVEPPPEKSLGTPLPSRRGAAPSEFDRVRRNFEAEIRRLEAIVARTEAAARQ